MRRKEKGLNDAKSPKAVSNGKYIALKCQNLSSNVRILKVIYYQWGLGQNTYL